MDSLICLSNTYLSLSRFSEPFQTGIWLISTMWFIIADSGKSPIESNLLTPCGWYSHPYIAPQSSPTFLAYFIYVHPIAIGTTNSIYIHSHICSLSILSFGWSNTCLIVVWGFKDAPLLKLLASHSEGPVTYGNTTYPSLFYIFFLVCFGAALTLLGV
jgi:hypothetical protein